MSYESCAIIVNFGKHVRPNSMSSPHKKNRCRHFLSFFFSFFLQFVCFFLLFYVFCFLLFSFLSFFLSPSPRFLCSQLFLSFLALQFGLWFAFMGFIYFFIFLFRFYGFYGRIRCGVEGVGSVSGSAMVDGFDFVFFFFLWFMRWWMEYNGGKLVFWGFWLMGL